MTTATHLSPATLSARWEMSAKSLAWWRQCKKGPAWVKLGHLVRYPIEDVEAYEATHRQGGAG